MSQQIKKLYIDGKPVIGEGLSPYVIAEIGTNHDRDVEKAKCILDALDKKDKFSIVLREDLEKGISVRIGKENQWDEIKECSLVTATYKLNGRVIGKIGVIGPTRINYPKIISLVEYMTDTLTEVFSGQDQINEEVNGDEG
jgi:transcriptional regulator of heat shock response